MTIASWMRENCSRRFSTIASCEVSGVFRSSHGSKTMAIIPALELLLPESSE